MLPLSVKISVHPLIPSLSSYSATREWLVSWSSKPANLYLDYYKMGLFVLRKSILWFTLLGLTLLVISMRPGVVFGAWPDDPETNVAVCTARGTQEHPRIASDGAAGAIVVWQDISSSFPDIYAQRVDARGIIRWTKDGVAICLEKDEQWLPNLVYDAAGGAIIAWWDKRSGNMDIYAQRVNGDGEVQWQSGGVPICAARSYQQEFDITADGEGGAIIAWHDYRAGSGAPDIYVQRINAKGETQWERDGIVVTQRVSYQGYPSIVSDGTGGAIIVWHDWREGNGDIYAQRVDAMGRTLWQEHGVTVCRIPEHQWYAATTTDGEGGAIIAWMDHRYAENDQLIARTDHRNGSGWDVYAQRLDPQGKPQWQINGVPVCLAQGDQYDYSILGDDAGGAFITWHDQRDGHWDIYAQKLDASGNAEWVENGLPVCAEPNDQYNPNMAGDGADGVIITWWDKRDVYADVYAQRIDAAGNFLWIEGGAAISIASGSQQDPYPVNSGVGSAIIAWWDKRKVDADIYVQRVISE